MSCNINDCDCWEDNEIEDTFTVGNNYYENTNGCGCAREHSECEKCNRDYNLRVINSSEGKIIYFFDN